MSVYAFSDTHGAYWVWEQIKSITKPRDRIYFLGDATDRGPDGWRIMKELLDDPRVIYLKGNHEDLMAKALKNYNSKNQDDWSWSHEIELWYFNGGRPTHIQFLEDNIPEEEKIRYLNHISNLPFCAIYPNEKGQDVLLCHAGCENMDASESWEEKDFLWNRDHYLFNDTWEGGMDEVIVHGHTPIELMIDDQSKYINEFILNLQAHSRFDNIIEFPDEWSKKGAYWYAHNHKVNIDTGAVWNHTATLINLDTWEEIILNKNT